MNTSLRHNPITRAPFLLRPLIVAAARLPLVLSAIIAGAFALFPGYGNERHGTVVSPRGRGGVDGRRHVRFAA